MLQNVLTGPRGRIDVADNCCSTRWAYLRHAKSVAVVLVSATGTLALDPQHGRFYSIVNSGASQTIDVFDMNVTNSLTLLGTIPATGEVGGVSEITRFGSDGLALRTPTQVILIDSALVPEPSSLILLAVGVMVFGGFVAPSEAPAIRIVVASWGGSRLRRASPCGWRWGAMIRRNRLARLRPRIESLAPSAFGA